MLIEDQDVGLFSNQMYSSHPGKCYVSGKNSAYTTDNTVMSYTPAYNKDGVTNNKFTSQDVAQIKDYWTVSTEELLT